MKRRVTTRCAAANDDEEGSWTSGDERALPARLQNTSPPRKAGRPSESMPRVTEPRKKKEKEFAWMDSEEEEDGEEVRGPKVADCGGDPEAAKHKENEDDEDVSVQALDAVQSFGRMMLLAPAIAKRLRDVAVSPEEAGAICRAMARTKFFDGDMLKDLKAVLMKMLAADQLSIASVNDVIMCLWKLNAYDQRVFSAAAKALKPKIVVLDQQLRLSWLEVYRGFGHIHEKDFLQLLEVPPLPPISPAFQKVRCRFFDKGSCALGLGCSYSHDPRAPVSLEPEGGGRHSPLVMTQGQYNTAGNLYGGKRNGLLTGTG